LIGKYSILNEHTKMPKRSQTPEVAEYAQSHKTVLATTRFNEKTWEENQEFMRLATRNGELSNKIKCLYPCSVVIGNSIPFQSNVFVLEMNNDQNQIMGIGLIKNTSPMYQKFHVYEVEKHNMFTYMGGYRIDRAEFTEEEKKVVSILEAYCFKGKRHQKRLNGIKMFPIDILHAYSKREEQPLDLNQEIANMFKHRFIA
jgi:hypothetical protein